MTRKVAVLRPEPGASRTADHLRDLGLDPVVAPLFTIEPVTSNTSNDAQPDALMITSANAVRHGAETIRQYPNLPIYAVGPATARALTELTDQPIHLAPEGNGQSLIARAKTDHIHHLLHLCGAEVRPLDPMGIQIDRQIIYRAAPASQLSTALITAWPDLDLILLHSPRSSALLDHLATAQGLARHHITAIAISAAAATAAGTGWNAMKIAPQPDDDGMLAVVRQLCQ
ncbi:uroporphyrinogen-III synthase [Aquisediminimonas sediminicola]|uniref:uroporphyrinogen-III synthase n=1 Tax=Alteraquisediminimonas sediminicola TaxID=2676787 RepID=UPI001C8EE4FF|nr:uroporphyrinogen-III synthase [Aquisediminimonas sediminicola]